MAAARKPGPKRPSAPGSVAVVKKLAVSFTRCTDEVFDSAPVSAMGRPAYLFMKVAMNAPRIMNGASMAIDTRLARAP
jgi:hypothetical protein